MKLIFRISILILIFVAAIKAQKCCELLTESDKNNFEKILTTPNINGSRNFNFSLTVPGELLRLLSNEADHIQCLFSINLTVSEDFDTIINLVQVNVQEIEKGLIILNATCSDEKLILNFEEFKKNINLQLSELKLNKLKFDLDSDNAENAVKIFDEIVKENSLGEIIDIVYDNNVVNAINIMKIIQQLPKTSHIIDGYFHLFLNMAAHDHLATYSSIIMLQMLKQIKTQHEILSFEATKLEVMKNVLKSNLKNIFSNFDEKYYNYNVQTECQFEVSKDDLNEIVTVLEGKIENNVNNSVKILDSFLKMDKNMNETACTILNYITIQPDDSNIWETLIKFQSFTNKFECNVSEKIEKLSVPEIMKLILDNPKNEKLCIENNFYKEKYLFYTDWPKNLSLVEYDAQKPEFAWQVVLKDNNLFYVTTRAENIIDYVFEDVELEQHGTLFKIKLTGYGYLTASHGMHSSRHLNYRIYSEVNEMQLDKNGDGNDANGADLWIIEKCVHEEMT